MKKLSILFITAASVLLAGCDSMLDINHNPNRMESLDEVSTMLPAAQMGIAYNLMSWDVAFGTGYWVQYWTQNYTASQFKDFCRYANTSFNTFYTSFMVGPMKDLKYMIDVAKEDEGQISYYYIAEALQIFGWQFLVDLYDNVPYKEALQGDDKVYNPHFDEGEAIYDDLLKRVDALLELDVSHAYIDKDYDMIYGGNMESWMTFTKALKLKLLMRMSETSKYNNASLITFIEDNADLQSFKTASISGSNFENQNSKRHPLHEYSTGTNFVSQNVIACKSFFNYLQANNDPRLVKFFNGSRAAFFGDYESKADSEGAGTPDDKQSYATARVAQNADLVLISTWENYFRIAEAYVRAQDYATAGDFYEEAVDAIFAEINATGFITSTSDANYGPITNTVSAAGGYAEWPAAGSMNDYLELIGMQRWISYYYFQHGEAFLERNRTKYPSVADVDVALNRPPTWASFPVGQLTVSVVGRDNLGGNLPSSLMYPSSVILRNTNALPQKPNVGQKVWWDKKAGK